jgi:hypothetical protein
MAKPAPPLNREDITMRSFTKAAVAAAIAAGTLAAPATAFAAGNNHSGATVGDCVSDGFYGNEPNMANGAPGGPAEQTPGTQAGNVLPSQSPGPFKTLPDGTVVRGSTIGDWQQAGFNIPQLCRAYLGS